MRKLLLGLAFASGSMLLQAQQNATNFKYLDINRVKAGVSCKNLMHFDSLTGGPSYEVPQGSNTHSGIGASLWISGYDAGNVLHTAAQTYRQSGQDFWPGPLDITNASITPSVSAAWNKVWKINASDIASFLSGNAPSNDILAWPGNGDLSLGQASLQAPYVDVNADGHYDPANGDYPKIKGDQAIFYIVNDKLAAHTSSGGASIGIEMQVMAYAYNCPQVLAGHNELAYTTFYDYKIINRSANTLRSTYVSLWNDVDLGYYGDDFLGSDINRQMGFVYNGDAVDQSSSGQNGYGNYPPAQGVTILNGPLADPGDAIDNDMDGLIDELGETIGMTKLIYCNNSFPGIPMQTTFPATAADYRNYQTAYWKDGTPFSCGGNGYGGSTATSYVYPENSYPSAQYPFCGTGWTEASAGNVPGDRMFILSSGPFTLSPGAVEEVEYAYVTSFDSTNAGNPGAAVIKLKSDVDKIRQFYQTGMASACNPGIQQGVKQISESFHFSLYPNPATAQLTVSCSNKANNKIHCEIADMLGRTVISMQTSQQESFVVDITSLNPGVYFIKLNINGTSSVKKFIKD
ncbi:MAG: T9SS type A sorting domain-containing protein [Bacteroidetes bacterium]|nr:T9SS type A sorting domain-containing protein [Bacteroidota bacterium]